jgi:hypothetical protein
MWEYHIYTETEVAGNQLGKNFLTCPGVLHRRRGSDSNALFIFVTLWSDLGAFTRQISPHSLPEACLLILLFLMLRCKVQ